MRIIISYVLKCSSIDIDGSFVSLLLEMICSSTTSFSRTLLRLALSRTFGEIRSLRRLSISLSLSLSLSKTDSYSLEAAVTLHDTTGMMKRSCLVSGDGVYQKFVWWKCDLVNFVASHLDAESLVSFSLCCVDVNANMKSTQTLKWLADLRDVPYKLDNLEQLELAEAMANFKSMIYFEWGNVEMSNPNHISIGVVARALNRHPNLSLVIEAHCGLEGMIHMPHPGQANAFTLARAGSVRRALNAEIERQELQVKKSQVIVCGWGFQRPLKLAWRQGYEDFIPEKGIIDDDASAKNRRVELYLKFDTDFEVPKRPQYAVESTEEITPAFAPDTDDDNDVDDDNDDDEAHHFTRRRFFRRAFLRTLFDKYAR
jgi:hypothetical protein